MIKGLLLAGKSPTHASVIKDLRGIKSYNANGLLPVTFNYSTDFGHNPSVNCSWFLKAMKTGFALASPKPTCAGFLAGSSSS